MALAGIKLTLAETQGVQPTNALAARLANELDPGRPISRTNGISPVSPLSASADFAESARNLSHTTIDQPTVQVQCGSMTVSLPVASKHTEYLDCYFAQLNSFHPTVNENQIREQSDRLYGQILGRRGHKVVPSSSAPFLALLLSIYASTEALQRSVSPPTDSRRPGYPWYRQARDLTGTRERPSDVRDITSVQTLVIQTFFFVYSGDMLAAYATIGRAARLCYLQGINRPLRASSATPFELHMRQRVVMVVYFMDHRLSLNTGRPYCMRWDDIDVSEPSGVNDLDVFHDMPLPPEPTVSSLQPYLRWYLAFAHYAGATYDCMSSGKLSSAERALAIEQLDQQLDAWTREFDASPVLTPTGAFLTTLYRQQRLICRTVSWFRR